MHAKARAGSGDRGSREVRRLGYGAMQLTGPGIFGPPRDRAAALAVLRTAVERGVNHIDTSDFYGPHLNLAHRDDDALIRQLARDGIAYAAFFPLGGFSPPAIDGLICGSGTARCHTDASGAGLEMVAASSSAQ